MKLTSSLLGLALAGILASVGAGCKKAPPPPPAAHNGVVIDSAKLREALNGANQDIQRGLAKSSFGIRYGDYVAAMMALDTISADPSLNDAQKKVIAEVMEQVKTANNNKNAGAGAEPAK